MLDRLEQRLDNAADFELLMWAIALIAVVGFLAGYITGKRT